MSATPASARFTDGCDRGARRDADEARSTTWYIRDFACPTTASRSICGRCIGCHACTIACKAEHEIPIGVNRCWVKTVEKGTFPDTRRFFFPVLCNQCDEAPCARICPTNALFKRRDGIVDLHGDSCIGCRACMVACPYDQLFIDPNTHTAEKCNFCANRIENELLPACVSVCPTECRIFGDLDDPTSEVARIAQLEAVAVRKPEKGTIPKVFYIGADESVLQPEIATRPFMFKEGQVILRPLGSPDARPDAAGRRARRLRRAARQAVGLRHGDLPFDQGDRHRHAARQPVAAGRDPDAVRRSPRSSAPAISLVFLAVTAVVLVADLERPERFYYILVRPNWRSWMVWGAYFLTAQGALTTVWIAGAVAGADVLLAVLRWPLAIVALATTGYTGLLFAQGLARDLWQGPQSTIDLVAQAIVEGAAMLLLAAMFARRPRRCRARTGARHHAGRGYARPRGHRVGRTSRDAQPDAPSRARRGGDPARRIRAAVLGRRDRRRRCRHRDCRCRRRSAGAGCAGGRRAARARRQLRMGIHLGRGGTERAVVMTQGRTALPALL